MRVPRLRSSPSIFHPSTNRRMYRLASSGEIGDPCGMPRRLSRASVVRVFRPLTWPRQIPIDGEPAEVHEAVAAYAQWLATSDFPKLFFKVEPGAILTNDKLLAAVRAWPNLTELTVRGIHFVQEDSPHEIGAAIADWIRARQ